LYHRLAGKASLLSNPLEANTKQEGERNSYALPSHKLGLKYKELGHKHHKLHNQHDIHTMQHRYTSKSIYSDN
jgi:hypothetical protein